MSLRYNIKNNVNIKTYVYFKPTDSDILDDIKLLLESDGEINVYPNEEELNPENSYKNVTDYIYRIINNTGFLCRGLNPDYILDVFETADAVVIIGSSMNVLPNGNIYGFALINFDEAHNSIYIDVICSHIGIKYGGDFFNSNNTRYLWKTFYDKNILKICKKCYFIL